METNEAYLATLARMEPDIAMVDRDAALASIAISMRRIADKLDVLGSSPGLFKLVSEVDAMAKAMEDV